MSITRKDEKEGLCGLGSCTPKFLQSCANIKVFGIFYGFNFLVTISVGIYISSQITSIEKQFNFSSEESGLITSTNDIGFVLTVLIFSFYGRRSHIPVCLGISTVLFGLSGLICAIPYFLFPVDEIFDVVNSTSKTLQNEALCSASNALAQNQSLLTGTTSKSPLNFKEMSNQAALLILCLGIALQGVGKAPRTSLATTYIDDSLEKNKVGLFMGLLVGIGIFGPAIAFILGAKFSSMYVNLKPINISPRDSRWIGAWWLGFIIFGTTALFAAVPMFFFPKKLKDRRVDLKHEKHAHKKQYIKEFFVAFAKLAKKPIYVLLCLKSLIAVFVMAGTFPFAAKYVETQFQVPSWKSNILIGAFGILIASVGTIAGGIMTYKLKMTPFSCLKMTTIVTVCSCIFPVIGYILGCEQPVILKPGETSGLFASLPSNCSVSCFCNDDMFQPICGADGNNYFSPCHAGCTSMDNGTYINCNCVQELTKTAVPSYCPTKCTNLWPATIVGLIASLLQCMTIMPDYILLLRSINEADKPFALGVQSFLLSLLGFIPGPIVFGKLIDTTCLKWKSAARKGGLCVLYDLHQFRLKLSLARFVASVAISITFLVIYYFARNKKDWQTNDENPEIATDPEEETGFIEKNRKLENN